MKDIASRIVAVLFFVFVIGVLGFMTYTAYSSISRVTDDDLLRYGTLMFFDAGALIWFGAFMFDAKGVWQRAISGIGFAVGFLGTLTLMTADIILGQTMATSQTAVAGQQSGLYLIILAVVIGAAGAHAALIYAYKLAAPANIDRIEDETFEQKQAEKARQAKAAMRKQINAIQDLSLEKAQANLQQQANELAGYLSQNYEQIARQELLTLNLLARSSGPEVIDAQAVDTPPAPAYAPARAALPARKVESSLRWPWQKKQQQPAAQPAPAAPAQDVQALAAAVAALLANQQQAQPAPVRTYEQTATVAPANVREITYHTDPLHTYDVKGRPHTPGEQGGLVRQNTPPACEKCRKAPGTIATQGLIVCEPCAKELNSPPKPKPAPSNAPQPTRTDAEILERAYAQGVLTRPTPPAPPPAPAAAQAQAPERDPGEAVADSPYDYNFGAAQPGDSPNP